MIKNNIGFRWSGFDWASEQKSIMLVGAGGINSWVAFSLSRIMHELYIVDFDVVDETNVQGGQLYRTIDIGRTKVAAVKEICRQFGCTNSIYDIPHSFSREVGITPICITGLDNMATRKEVFELWEESLNKSINKEEHLLLDGRMNGELFEIFAIQGNNLEQIQEYKDNWLFSDSEVEELECTRKSTTFVAMGIASFITATLCNWLANKKMDAELKEVPFHQRFFVPFLDYKTESIEQIKSNANGTAIS